MCKKIYVQNMYISVFDMIPGPCSQEASVWECRSGSSSLDQSEVHQMGAEYRLGRVLWKS